MPAHSGVRAPDALEPDDEDELQPASRQRQHEPREVAHREGPALEQVEVEHWVGGVQLDEDEAHEDGDPAEQARQHEGAGPAHGVASVGLESVDDAGEQGNQPHREADVARPVDRRLEAPAVVTQL
jgi:hypothetical protein